jgi:hypothetical protein
MNAFKNNIIQILIALDQLLNVVIGFIINPWSDENWADESMSCRAGRLGDRYPYKVFKIIIDGLAYPFQGPNHCHNAYLKELTRYNMPPDMR